MPILHGRRPEDYSKLVVRAPITGLEPNEQVTWSLAPSMFSDWGDVKAPKNAILTVDVKKLDGPDGEVAYSIDKFGDTEQERLKELLSSYPEFLK